MTNDERYQRYNDNSGRAIGNLSKPNQMRDCPEKLPPGGSFLAPAAQKQLDLNAPLLDNTRLLLPELGVRQLRAGKMLEQKRIETKKHTRSWLFQDRRIAGSILPEERVSQCGRVPISAPGSRIHVCGQKGKYFTGIMNCGSVWSCPVCAKKIGLHRAASITELLRCCLQANGATPDLFHPETRQFSLGFLTLTVRHHRQEFLRDVLPRVLESWRSIEQSREYREEKKSVGYIGCVRAIEVKHGGNGWHPHLHLLLVGRCSNEAMRSFSEFLTREWIARNPDAVEDAQKFVPVHDEQGIADYITKWDAASEMTMGSEKVFSNAKQSVTPFQMLRVYDRFKMLRRHEFSSVYHDLYREYALTMKGKKQITISRGLLKEYEIITGRVFDMKSDEEINSEHQFEKPVVEIDRDIFKQINAKRLQAEVLNEIEYGSIEKCVELLNGSNIECVYNKEHNVIEIVRADEPFTLTSAEWRALMLQDS